MVGIYLCNGGNTSFVQLVGENITPERILEALQGVKIIYTYNGSRFDLPFIFDRLGIDLSELFEHYDLMYRCWQNNLYGGFKEVERQLGIRRQLTGINGLEAIRLWWRYVNNYDEVALAQLLAYNKEDVLNLRILRDRLL